jgi:cyclopropane fatty-acyl-phospholipid synthase-like methyltransferase
VPRKRTFIEVASIPTPMETVAEMLRLADLKKTDVLYDLGSGDGRIPLEAARKYSVRAIGIEIKPQLVAEANKRAKDEGLEKLAHFEQADLFRMNYRGATVVTLYLSDSLNERLRPKLLRELRPGSRIISHDFRMGDWQPEQTVRVPWENLYRTVYVWTVPEKTGAKKNGK